MPAERTLARDRLDGALSGAPIIGIVRLELAAASTAVSLVRAMAEGGLTVAEITLTTGGALESMSRLVRDPPRGMVIGCGSVRTVEEARAAIAAGAEVIVTPTTDTSVISVAVAAGIPILAGGFTPTELELAHRAGADFVKLFPASVAGSRYLRELLAPLPDLRIVPTGGVSPLNVAEWLDAGAVAVAAGGSLVPSAGISLDDVRIRASALVKAANDARREQC